MTAFLAWIPGLNDGGTLFGKTRNDLCTSAEDDEYDWLARGNKFLDELLLLSWQAKSLAVAVLSAEPRFPTLSAHGDSSGIIR